MDEATAVKAVHAVLDELLKEGRFDTWWSSLTEQDRTEIRGLLRERVKQVHR
jgi:hypothetical protein